MLQEIASNTQRLFPSSDHESNKDRDQQDNARSDSPTNVEQLRKKRRMKGIELADALLLPRQGSGASKNGLLPPVPSSVDSQPVNLLVSVFVHAQGDVGGLNKV